MSHAPSVGIAGLGLIGASIGLRAAACGWQVAGWDPDGEHASIARARGAVGVVLPSFAAVAREAETLVLAAPLDATVALLAALVAGPPLRATLIVDVASVKLPVARVGADLDVFVATHPIAGSERSGPRAARADLFAQRTWTYDAQADPAAASRARDFIEAMGAQPYAVANGEHDRILALTSHLPQLLSVALGTCLAPALENPAVVALCGTGMRSMLRLGASAWPVWQPIVAANRHVLAQEVRTLAEVLAMVAGALDDDRTDVLADDFATSARAVARLGANASERGPVEAQTTSWDERQSWIDGSHSAQP